MVFLKCLKYVLFHKYLGYGIATPKGSKWRDKISKAILFLQEKGVIQMYYDKWWKSHGRWPESGDCQSKDATLEAKSSVNALGVVNIGGVFVVLLVGLAFAVMVAIGEFCVKTRSAFLSSYPASLFLKGSFFKKYMSKN